MSECSYEPQLLSVKSGCFLVSYFFFSNLGKNFPVFLGNECIECSASLDGQQDFSKVSSIYSRIFYCAVLKNITKGNRVCTVYLSSFFKREGNIQMVTRIHWELKKKKSILSTRNKEGRHQGLSISSVVMSLPQLHFCCHGRNPDKKQLRGGKVYFSLQFQVIATQQEAT